VSLTERVAVLVVHGDRERQQQLTQALSAAGIQVVGSAATGGQAITALERLKPHVVLIERDLPDGDGIRQAEAITARYPWLSVIVTAPEENPDALRRAMLAGARLYLAQPFSDQELVESVRSLYARDASRREAVPQVTAGPAGSSVSPAAPQAAREGQLYTFYSAKGGVGCTTLACNLAVALKRSTNKDVAIFDCGLLFGDVGVVLNLNPRSTITDLLPHCTTGPLDGDVLRQMMVGHASGVQVLLAPSSPEKAELITPEHIRRVLVALREQFDYVVVDTWPTFEERILHVLDASDKIVVPTTLEMPAIKNSKLLLDVTGALSYPPEKIQLVLNRADSRGGIRVQDVEQILQRGFAAEIVSDGRLTTHSLNEGVPFVMSNPEAQISQHLVELARTLSGISASAAEEVRPRKLGLLRTVFGS
jgi:pilus assembly protein CpaE